MNILKSLSLADLQKFAFMLTQLEAAGVRSLSDGRARVEDKLRLEHRLKQKQMASRIKKGRSPVEIKKTPCPECGSDMSVLILDSESAANGMTGFACKECRYSTTMEKD